MMMFCFRCKRRFNFDALPGGKCCGTCKAITCPACIPSVFKYDTDDDCWTCKTAAVHAAAFPKKDDR